MYKVCGKGTSSHEICVLSFNDCPVDNILIDKNAASPDTTYTTLTLNEGYFLHFTSFADQLPIVDFAITEGNVCIFPDEYDHPKDKAFYPLLKTWKYNG